MNHVSPDIRIVEDWFYATTSQIHGLGVFSRENVRKGETLTFDLPMVTNEEYYRLEMEAPDDEPFYFLSTNHNTYDIRKSILRFLNHSDKPTIDYHDGFCIVALEDIRIGDELTIDYGWEESDWES